MKTLFFVFLLLLLFGCAEKSAYSKFKLFKDQEVAFDNVSLGKITRGQKISGVISALYLNEIYPKKFTKEAFYIIVYTKDADLLSRFEVTLNSNFPVLVTKLPPQNEYSHLLDIRNSWSYYYFVEFTSTKSASLKLSFKLQNGAKATVEFQKNL